MQFIAKSVSILFHPLFMPTYAMAFLMYANPYLFGSSNVPILMQVIYNSVFFPVLTLLLMRILDFIDTFEVRTRDERLTVYIPTLVFFIWTFTVFFKSDYPGIITDVMMGACIGLSIAFVFAAISEIISLHAIGMGGMIAVIYFATTMAKVDIRWCLVAVVGIAGLVGTARLFLKAHEPMEVYMGYMIGFSSQALAFIIGSIMR